MVQILSIHQLKRGIKIRTQDQLVRQITLGPGAIELEPTGVRVGVMTPGAVGLEFGMDTPGKFLVAAKRDGRREIKNDGRPR